MKMLNVLLVALRDRGRRRRAGIDLGRLRASTGNLAAQCTVKRPMKFPKPGRRRGTKSRCACCSWQPDRISHRQRSHPPLCRQAGGHGRFRIGRRNLGSVLSPPQRALTYATLLQTKGTLALSREATHTCRSREYKNCSRRAGDPFGASRGSHLLVIFRTSQHGRSISNLPRIRT